MKIYEGFDTFLFPEMFLKFHKPSCVLDISIQSSHDYSWGANCMISPNLVEANKVFLEAPPL